jgi:hypothetical protein
MFLSTEQEKKVRSMVDAGKWPPYPRFDESERRELRRVGTGEIRRRH